MSKKRFVVPNKAKIRNLVQYKDLSEDEFDEIFEAKYGEDRVEDVDREEYESRLDEKLKELEQDYDFSDMKSNDMSQLRSLVSSMVQLEDVDLRMFELNDKGMSANNIAEYEKLSRVASTLKTNISSIQTDLHLTRRIRKQDTEQSVISALENLKLKAKKFARHSMLYVFCPNCRKLLATIWLLYTENENIVKLNCECGHSFEVSLAELYTQGNKNLEDITLP